MNTLYQKKGLSSRRFTIKDSSIEIEHKSFSKTLRYSVKLEQLGFELQYHRKNNLAQKVMIYGSMLAIAAFTVFLFIQNQGIEFESVYIVYVISIALFIAGIITEYPDDIYLLGSTNLIFHRNKPNETQVLEFIETVKSATKKFLKDKYTAFDEATTSQEFYNCIRWLYDKEIITRQEYIDYKASFDMQQLLH